MFGHHNLYRDGVPARSVIISMRMGVANTVGHSKQEHFVDGDQIPHETPDQKVFFDVVATVEFGDGSTGQHAERLWRHQAGICHIGDVLPVRYDRQHRDKIVFDLPELEANRYSPKERADGQPAQAQPHQVTDLASLFGAGNSRTVRADAVRNLLSELTTDPQGFAAHVRQMAEEGGTNTFVVTSTSTSGTGPVAEESGFPLVSFGDDEVEDV
jgi:hypothetical protein